MSFILATAVVTATLAVTSPSTVPVVPFYVLADMMPDSIGDAAGIYATYDPALLDTDTDVVLFFHAGWCTTCNAAKKNFQKSALPTGLTILEVDYDTADDLRAKYNVLTQSTYVYIDKKGVMRKRRVGSTTVQQLLTQLDAVDAGVQKPRERLRDQRMSDQKGAQQTVTLMQDSTKDANSLKTMAVAYFAGGCFWCMEAGFESLGGVDEAISGYAGGSQADATYKKVGTGKTAHREAIKVVYDPEQISYDALVEFYRTQVDPTDGGGQFADRGFQYTPAIYVQNNQEKTVVAQQIDTLNASGHYDSPIAVQIDQFTTFFPAEEKHQDYYLKQSKSYKRYATGSGRKGYIAQHESAVNDLLPLGEKTNETILGAFGPLTDQQVAILFNGGTEPPFDNAYRDNHQPGIYVDVIDGTPLFSSLDKFDSGTGRPSFTRPIDQAMIGTHDDARFGLQRTEVKSAESSGHLGHVFNDGPNGGQRYCINSAALYFVSLDQMESLGYGEFLPLFQ